MPNVVLEAMAASRPIVAFEVEGIAEALGNDASRQIAAREDRDGFIERVVEIAANFDLRESLGRANCDRVKRQFAVENMVFRYERLYLELIASGSGSLRAP